MKKIYFLDDRFIVKYRSESVTFLPKEYQLLKFLYKNPSRIFSRQELLNAVWPMEDPMDRTVDDHIYRIRKRLEPLSSVICIETVRGRGYLLRLKKDKYESGLLKDKEVSANIKNLFQKYHLYGHGDALKLLAENQDIFGFEVDLEGRLYLKFMNGDFNWFLETEEVSFWEKCYYLLHIFFYTEPDKKKCLDYFTRSLNYKKIPNFYRLEIRLLNRLSLLIFTKQLDEAEYVLRLSEQEIAEKQLEGYILWILFSKFHLAFLRRDFENIEILMMEMEKALLNYPFLREKANFSIIKGIYFLFKNNQTKAEEFFEQGFKLYKKAKYIPGKLIGLNTVLLFLEEFNITNSLYTLYQKMWKKYAKEYNFTQLNDRIKNQLDYYLK